MLQPHHRSWRVDRSRSRGPAVLHHLGALLSLPTQARQATGSRGRRQRQRLALAQRLLESLPGELQASGGGDWFWRPLRWGSVGLLLAWWLRR